MSGKTSGAQTTRAHGIPAKKGTYSFRMLFPMVACTLTFQIPPALELKISYVGIFPNFPWRWISPIPTARDFPNSRGAGFSEIPWGYISKFPWRWMSQTAVASYLPKFTWPWICQTPVALDLPSLHGARIPKFPWGYSPSR